MIDNWFSGGCFGFSWYVEVEFQFALILTLLFWLYGVKREAALGIIYSLLFVSFLFLFIFAAPLPNSLETAISSESIAYFRSFHSHFFFYLLGTTLSFLFRKESVRSFLRNNFTENISLFTGSITVAFALVVFIVFKPQFWVDELVLELGLSRIAMMLAFIVFFSASMVNEEVELTRVHKLAKLTYPVILWGGLIVSC